MTYRICNQNISRNSNREGQRRTFIVVIITAITMFAEIVYGLFSGSMALLADGIHMGTHTFALLITLLAYYLSDKYVDNSNFSFSTGKIGILGGYTNAILLGIIAVYMIYEAIRRLLNPEQIFFNQALIVAVIGLAVNLVSAWLLSLKGSGHEHRDHHDHNLRAAYLHVVTDAMTSILAIFALLLGKYFDAIWPDSVVAILGALVILKWAYGLLISSGKLLVDNYDADEEKIKIKEIIDAYNSKIIDLHIWKISENRKAIIISISAGKNLNRNDLVERLRTEFVHCHLTLEIAER